MVIEHVLAVDWRPEAGLQSTELKGREDQPLKLAFDL